MSSAISPLTGILHINGAPAYQIERLIGSGGSAMCYLARRILPDGSLGTYVVIKEFCPSDFDAPLKRRQSDHVIVPDGPSVHAEFEHRRQAFLKEAALCQKVNTTGKSNYPWVLSCERVPGRDDLLAVATEDGFTLRSFMEKRGHLSLSRDYVLLCLLILSRLLEALRGIHRSVLHLDVSPNNVYLVAENDRLNSESIFSIKLFDLASAKSKADCTPERRADTFMTLAYTPGYNDPALQSDTDPIDERSDWYSAAAVFYTLLTGETLETDDPEFFMVSLPRSGVLENDAIRSDIESLLNRALKLEDPFTAEDVERDTFARQVSSLVTQLRYMSVRAVSNPSLKTDQPALLLFDDTTPQEYDALEAALIDTFTPMETEIYAHQSTLFLRENGLKRSPLSTIKETVHETRILFDALEPWFAVNLSAAEHGILRDHLLIAAKLHNVGLAGSEEDCRQLYALDRLYTLAKSRSMGMAKAIAPLSRHLAGSPAAALADQLCTQHDSFAPTDEILRDLHNCRMSAEKKIYGAHASQSARFILNHRAELAAHYGSGVDFVEVALLAALHESTDDLPTAESMMAFLAGCGVRDQELAHVEGKTKRILMEASILRLAAFRKSGSRLALQGNARPVVHRNRSGRLSLLLETGGVMHLPQNIREHDALLCAKLFDFGPVSLKQTNDGWQMTHSITCAHADTRDAQMLLLSHGIPAYVTALKHTLLSPGHMRHVLRVTGTDVQNKPLLTDKMVWLKKADLEQGFVLAIQE